MEILDDRIILTEMGNLTFDSTPVQNGIADWVYEEEILSDTKAYYWSDSGKYLGRYERKYFEFFC